MLRTFCLATILLTCLPAVYAQEVVTIALPDNASSSPLQGRLLLLVSPNDTTEPRFQVRAGPRAIQVFGQNVTGWVPGSRQLVDPYADGYPLSAWSELEAGTYTVQAFLNRYETFELATGHTVSLPPDRGEGQQWNRKPGNRYSTPQTLRLNPTEPGTLELVLDQEIPPIVPPEDTEYIRHITIQSDLLTEFWGRPMMLGAHVLLPHGFDEHPEARYPLMIFHGHFPNDFGGFRAELHPTPDVECLCTQRDDSGSSRVTTGSSRRRRYAFYQTVDLRCRVPPLPHHRDPARRHPYYDDSYAVNSANLGPYGDAITHELIPYIEKKLPRSRREVGRGFLYGGSTGGWEALAAQVFYPEDYNGAFAACPDPIDFRAYVQTDIYSEHAMPISMPGAFRQHRAP